MPYPRSHSEVPQMEMEPTASVPTPTNAYAFDLSSLGPHGF